jgi:hypothetical protein
MILGYSISGCDNGYHMLGKAELPECAKYMDVYQINKVNLQKEFRSIKEDLSYTYDGFSIVTEKFREFCEKEGYGGLEFVALSGSQPYFWFKIHTVIEFDSVRRRTRFLEFNAECNGYEEIIGAHPVILKNNPVLADGFYRTDLCFGSYSGKSPTYCVGIETRRKLLAAGFGEIDYEEISDEYPR